MNYIEVARRLREVIVTASASLDDKTASTSVELFPRLKQDGDLIKTGTRINWNGTIKRATVDIWDMEGNDPDNAPTLWASLDYFKGYRIIPQVITVTTSFANGECGWWNDDLYVSKVDNNVYTPEQYINNWEKLVK